MSKSLSSRIVPAALEWFFEQDDRVFVLFALDTYGSTLSPFPVGPIPTIDVTCNSKNGPIQKKLLTINVSSQSTSGFAMLDEGLSFKCRFSGKATDVFISYDSIVRLECPNIGLSYEIPFVFPDDEVPKPQEPDQVIQEPKKSRANLTLVK